MPTTQSSDLPYEWGDSAMDVAAETSIKIAPQAATEDTAATRVASRVVFVVGAGRSGTSTLTRGLLALGVDLGNRIKAASPKNPTGFFEDRELLLVGKQARSALGLKVESVALVTEDDWARPELVRLRAQAAAIVADRFGDCPLWGFKYAQTLRYLPFWLSVIADAGMQIDFVVAIRNPLAVARSRAKLDPLRGRQEKSDLEWLVNVVPYFRTLARHRFMVVDYDLLMADPRMQLARIADFLAVPRSEDVEERVRVFAEEFLDPGLYRNRVDVAELDGNSEINPLTRDAYKLLLGLATERIQTDDAELWRKWAQLEHDLASIGPVLRHVDYLEHRMRWATNPFRESLRGLKWKWHEMRWQWLLRRGRRSP